MTTTYDVLVQPIVTEKSVATENKFTFKVDNRASKTDVTKAVKDFYGVDVLKVNIVTLPEKTKVIGRGKVARRRAPLKKAIVTLKKGQKIDFNAFK
ncbi:MAG: 50S ribosomal protein L23 [Candidatus Peregrinibacteria bacterium]|nr:50S ribosomal protein L23 [Candidatus Peregrinibacteria bacterium]